MLSCLQEPHAELLPNQPLLGSITAFDQDEDILVSPYSTAYYMVNQLLTQIFYFHGMWKSECDAAKRNIASQEKHTAEHLKMHQIISLER